MTTFTCRTARSAAIPIGIGIVLTVESVVLHLWLVSRHPAIASALTLSSLVTLAWLAADWRAMGHAGVDVGEGALSVRIGRRFVADVPRAGQQRGSAMQGMQGIGSSAGKAE